MKKILGILLIVAAIGVTSCKQECEKGRYGYFQFNNKTSKSVNVYIDNSFAYALKPNELTDVIRTKSGIHYFYAETPNKQTFWSDNRTVIDCEVDVVSLN